tara:strand:+ start:149 stop:1765 length:1617 start_codon:yes stop_codon:yes gene_type:complete
MAEKIIIDLEAKTDKALKGIQDLSQEVGDLNDEVAKGNKRTEQGLKGIENASKNTAKGVRGIGTALKAAGIGLAIAAFAQLREVFLQNQKAADFFNTAFEVVSLAFNDFVNFIVNNTGTVVDFFNSIFENPKQSLVDFANAFKRNIQERFESFLETLGFLASAVQKVFRRDFAGALEDVKSAGKESLDVLTGVNDTFDKGTEVVKKVAKATTNYTKTIIEQGKQIVKTNKAADKSAVINQLLIEQFDRQAELQRQIRDDESKTIDERIAANEELGRILEEQEKLQKEALQTRVDAAQLQFDKIKNDENEIALLEAKNELAAVEATLTGLRSEQLVNLNSLERERADLVIENAEKEIEAEQKKIEQKQMAVDAIIGLTNQETAIGKAALIARQLLALQELKLTASTALKKIAVDAAGSGVDVAKGFSATLKAGFPANIPLLVAYAGQAAGIISAIVSATKKAKSSVGSIGSSASISTPIAQSAPTSQPPAFNIVGASGTNQLAETIAGQNERPIKAFVTSQDVTTAQSLERNIVEGASI